jgi:hypothetical protein
MMRNVRKSKLGSLSQAQRDQLVRWLLEDRLTYEAAVDRVAKEFGVHTSMTGMHNFYQKVCAVRLNRRNKLKDAFLDINVRVRAGGQIIAETEFSVSLSADSVVRKADKSDCPDSQVSFDVTTNSPTSHS